MVNIFSGFRFNIINKFLLFGFEIRTLLNQLYRQHLPGYCNASEKKTKETITLMKIK